jgi:hypothetical protein
MIENSKYNIPSENIYKIILLDNVGSTKGIYIFSKGKIGLNNIFSNSVIETINNKNIPVTFADYLIHKDDNISTIKKKLLLVLGKTMHCYEELYMYINVEQTINPTKLFSLLTNNKENELKKDVVKIITENLNIKISEKNDLQKDFYNYEEFIELFGGVSKVIRKIPLGLRFIDKQENILFSGDPYIENNDTLSDYKLAAFENELLLNYPTIQGNTIYLTTATSIFEWIDEKEIDRELYIKTYFPFLFKKSIFTSDEFASEKYKLIEENTKILLKENDYIYKSIDMFYEVYYGRKNELKYLSKGMKDIVLKVKSSMNVDLHLDVIFKNLHSTKNVPFIKYNSGPRQENIYRFYTEQKTYSGKNIPYLNENTINILSRELGKSKQISLFIHPEENDTGSQNVIVHLSILNNGDLIISTQLKSPMSYETLNTTIKEIVNPMIDIMNGHLEQIGYSLRTIDELTDNYIEIVGLDYFIEYNLEKEFNLGNFMGCITSVFDIKQESDINGTEMVFKRVENFSEMDAQQTLISDIYKKTGDYGSVIKGLMQNYKMSQDIAEKVLLSYLNDHIEIQGKFVDNPGFMVYIKLLKSENKVSIIIKNITSIKYIETLNVYFDSILRITQEPDSSIITKQSIIGLCNKAKKIDKVIDKSHIENVVANTILETQPIKLKIQPINIGPEEDNDKYSEDESSIEDDAMFFLDDDEVDEEKSKNENEENESDEGIFFEDSKEEEEEESKSYERISRPTKKIGGKKTPENNYVINPVGMKLKDPYWIYTRLLKREPKLFATEEAGDPKYEGYSRICPSNVQLQPVILNKKEFEKQDPSTYNDYVKYGSDPANPYYYICPRYWCLLNNTAMTEEDVKQGKCAKQGKPDKVITRGDKVVPSDAFVYEFNNPKQHMDDKGNYRLHYPGFKVGKHPKGYPLPCCFIKPNQHLEHNMDNKEDIQENKKNKKNKRKREKNPAYIISNETFPIKEQGRYGYLPLSVQKFLQHNNNNCASENNAAIIKSEIDCLLRFGVEQVKNQSFLGSIAEFYSYKQDILPVISVEKFKKKLTDGETITLDRFIRYFNGYLVSVFKPKNYNIDNIELYKYEDTKFYKSIDLYNEYQMDFLEDTIAAYENFIKFLQSPDSKIDHTYLWDIITNENSELFPEGLNLIILEIVNNDITDNIKVICPTHSNTKKYFDQRKETVILIKYDDYYEPLYMYNEKDGNINTTRSFNTHTSMKNIKYILNIIEKTQNKYCISHPSLPKVYKFQKNIGLENLFTKLKELNYIFLYQVMNYQGKVIGVVIREVMDQENKIYIPCYPSAQISKMDDIPEMFIDENTNEIWSDYKTTIQLLNKVYNEGSSSIPCKPVAKVMDPESSLIVGILTQTNQFVMINPPNENIINDGLTLITSSNYIIADKEVTTKKEEDLDRIVAVKRIELESQFYFMFRSIIRELLGKYENREYRNKIVSLYSNNMMDYNVKIKKMIKYLIDMVNNKITFDEFDEKILLDLDTMKCNINKCSSETVYCFSKNNGCILVIPKYHLLSGADNEKIYYARVADELLRYKRIRLFMLHPNNYLNITDTNYKLNDNEFILLQTSIDNGYLKGLTPYNTSNEIINTAFNTAEPQISQKYSTQQISIEEQYENNNDNNSNQLNQYIVECIKETVEVIGNPYESIWKRVFPKKSREIIFKNNSTNCTFYILNYIFQDKHNVPISVQKIKELISIGYKELLPKYKDAIYKILKKQGKKFIMEKVEDKNKSVDLDTIVLTEEYYLTDIDIWVFAYKAKMQICLFSKNKLKGLNENLEWLILNKQYNEKHYFIRSPPLFGANKYGSYNIITPSYYLTELSEFEKIVQNAISGKNKEFSENIQSLHNFLEKS